jgi:hypothetical protein
VVVENVNYLTPDEELDGFFRISPRLEGLVMPEKRGAPGSLQGSVIVGGTGGGYYRPGM